MHECFPELFFIGIEYVLRFTAFVGNIWTRQIVHHTISNGTDEVAVLTEEHSPVNNPLSGTIIDIATNGGGRIDLVSFKRD